MKCQSIVTLFLICDKYSHFILKERISVDMSNQLDEMKARYDKKMGLYENLRGDIAKKLLLYRKECGLNQQDVASALGISRATLSYYENGSRQPDIEVSFRLCSFYGKTLNDLLSDTADDNAIELRSIGFDEDALFSITESPRLIDLLNDLAKHPDIDDLLEITVDTRSQYSGIDAEYRSFLAEKLLFSMVTDICQNWNDNFKDLPPIQTDILKKRIKEFLNKPHSQDGIDFSTRKIMKALKILERYEKEE